MNPRTRTLLMSTYRIPKEPWGRQIASWKRRKYASRGPSEVWSYSQLLADLLSNAGVLLLYDHVVHDENAFETSLAMGVQGSTRARVDEMLNCGFMELLDYSENLDADTITSLRNDFYNWTADKTTSDPEYERAVNEIVGRYGSTYADPSPKAFEQVHVSLSASLPEILGFKRKRYSLVDRDFRLPIYRMRSRRLHRKPETSVISLGLAQLVVEIIFKAFPSHVVPTAELDIDSFMELQQRNSPSLKGYRELVNGWMDSAHKLLATDGPESNWDLDPRRAEEAAMSRLSDHFARLEKSLNEVMDSLHSLTWKDKAKHVFKNGINVISLIPVVNPLLGVGSLIHGIDETTTAISTSNVKGAIRMVRQLNLARRTMAEESIKEIVGDYVSSGPATAS